MVSVHVIVKTPTSIAWEKNYVLKCAPIARRSWNTSSFSTFCSDLNANSAMLGSDLTLSMEVKEDFKLEIVATCLIEFTDLRHLFIL
mmetsp:Transcript_20241/g.38171  ORF Transcript_20241/g.38171 Transcript_20241/m.38171 type:complete len:87 (+) Transcript_20241:831-1091(+)